MKVDLYEAMYVSNCSVKMLHIGREPYMVNNLVGNATVVLEDIEVLGTAGLGDLLRDGLLKRYQLVSSVYQ